jgi:predicted ATP-grasp superfamily ATP-dependent carboligase
MSVEVLVPDGEQRAALAVVRSLGRAGYRPYVCSTSGRSLAGSSRYAAGEASVPDPLRDPAGFAEALAELVRRRHAGVVLPSTDAALLALLPARERLAGAALPFVDEDRFRRICDKAVVLSTAPDVGIRVPRQCVAADRRACLAAAEGGLAYPLVLKPARSVAETAGKRVRLSVRHALDQEALRSALDTLPEAAYPLLLQERIVGPGVGVFILLWNGEVKAAFSHRRIREKPPSGGVSVYRESIPLDPELLARSHALLERFGWNGVAMIEYKLDERTGAPYLMEINGRFWGSLQLAVDAGVDFPALLAGLALGRDPAPVTTYRVGVRSRWWWGDVDHLLARLRRSTADLALPPESPGRWRAVADFLTVRAADRNEILRLDDPRPILRETAQWLRGR